MTGKGTATGAPARLAQLLLPGCTAAEVIIGRGRNAVVLSADAVTHRVAEIRSTLVDVADLLSGSISTGADLAGDTGWAELLRRLAIDPGLTALAVLPLEPTDQHHGCLVLYGGTGDPLIGADPEKLRLVLDLAGIAMAAAAVRTQAENLAAALISNRQIGIAVGILMERLRQPEEVAFERLRHASQDRNVKLRDVAVEVATTGRLP